jgi:hypothetical protein
MRDCPDETPTGRANDFVFHPVVGREWGLWKTSVNFFSMEKPNQFDLVLLQFETKPVIPNLDTKVVLVSFNFFYVLYLPKRFHVLNFFDKIQKVLSDLRLITKVVKVFAESFSIKDFHISIH